MDIWTTHAARRGLCINCQKEILPGDRVVIGRWKRKYPWGVRTRQRVSHFNCWVREAEEYLDDHPYEPRRVAGPGRPIQYTQEQRRERRNLQVQISRWTRKQQEYIGGGLWAVAGRYKDKIEQARGVLEGM